MKLPIHKYLDLSTAHITEQTNTFLYRELQWRLSELIVHDKTRGYFIHVPESLEKLKQMDIPKDLKACLRLAQKHKCNWLVLDGDAETVDCLKTYDW